MYGKELTVRVVLVLLGDGVGGGEGKAGGKDNLNLKTIRTIRTYNE